jgi:hypothetical protein
MTGTRVALWSGGTDSEDTTVSDLGTTLVYRRRPRNSTIRLEPDELIATNVYQRDAAARLHASIAKVLQAQGSVDPLSPRGCPAALVDAEPTSSATLADRLHDVPQSWLLIAAFILSLDVVLGCAVLITRVGGWPL